ncbi:MAG: hypothetical protein HUK17_02530 [Bacteroidales bacterium]|nr:hypothetical protein [Bacteroidales bacterium]
MKKHFYGVLLATLALLFSACDKEPDTQPALHEGDAYLLNEGSWGLNNATLSHINTADGDIYNDYFAAVNGRGLGDIACDAIAYGSKMYVTVTESKTIEVVDLRSGKSVKQLSLSASPRYMVSHNGKVYVSCYDKTVRCLDTASLSLTATCNLGNCMQPEGIAISGNKLFVCSSWGYSSNGNYEYDHKIIVVDLATFTATDTIAVGTNPQRIKAMADGRLVFNYSGNYSSEPSGMSILNPTTFAITELGVEATNFDIYDGDIYLYYYDWVAMEGFFRRIDGSTLAVTPFLENISVTLTSLYGLSINPANGDIYVTDARDYMSSGDVLCFSHSGAYKWSASAGVGPSKVVFY